MLPEKKSSMTIKPWLEAIVKVAGAHLKSEFQLHSFPNYDSPDFLKGEDGTDFLEESLVEFLLGKKSSSRPEASDALRKYGALDNTDLVDFLNSKGNFVPNIDNPEYDLLFFGKAIATRAIENAVTSLGEDGNLPKTEEIKKEAVKNAKVLINDFKVGFDFATATSTETKLSRTGNVRIDARPENHIAVLIDRVKVGAVRPAKEDHSDPFETDIEGNPYPEEEPKVAEKLESPFDVAKNQDSPLDGPVLVGKNVNPRLDAVIKLAEVLLQSEYDEKVFPQHDFPGYLKHEQGDQFLQERLTKFLEENELSSDVDVYSNEFKFEESEIPNLFDYAKGNDGYSEPNFDNSKAELLFFSKVVLERAKEIAIREVSKGDSTTDVEAIKSQVEENIRAIRDGFIDAEAKLAPQDNHITHSEEGREHDTAFDSPVAQNIRKVVEPDEEEALKTEVAEEPKKPSLISNLIGQLKDKGYIGKPVEFSDEAIAPKESEPAKLSTFVGQENFDQEKFEAKFAPKETSGLSDFTVKAKEKLSDWSAQLKDKGYIGKPAEFSDEAFAPKENKPAKLSTFVGQKNFDQEKFEAKFDPKSKEKDSEVIEHLGGKPSRVHMFAKITVATIALVTAGSLLLNRKASNDVADEGNDKDVPENVIKIRPEIDFDKKYQGASKAEGLGDAVYYATNDSKIVRVSDGEEAFLSTKELLSSVGNIANVDSEKGKNILAKFVEGGNLQPEQLTEVLNWVSKNINSLEPSNDKNLETIGR